MSYKLNVPNIELSQNKFETIEQAYYTAKKILNGFNGVKFVSILHKDKQLTTLIKTGYKPYKWQVFKALSNTNQIKDFFIINSTYYIKLKTKNND